MQFAFDIADTDEARVLSVEGEIDVSCADELRDAIDEAVADEPEFVEIDLSQLSYIDSTGIGVLVGAAHRAADEGYNLVVSNPQANVGRVLDLLGVAEELGLEGSEED